MKVHECVLGDWEFLKSGYNIQSFSSLIYLLYSLSVGEGNIWHLKAIFPPLKARKSWKPTNDAHLISRRDRSYLICSVAWCKAHTLQPGSQAGDIDRFAVNSAATNSFARNLLQ